MSVSEKISDIFWIDIVPKDHRMPSSNNIIIAKPSHSLANILNVLTCASNYKIPRIYD